ncbi:MAG TPA: hypothetical protein VH986_13285 [Acidimicrobiia bacterium]|jgi:hypothetical protein
MTAPAHALAPPPGSPGLRQAFRRLRLVPRPTEPPLPEAIPAAPVAHPFDHEIPGARCPACELRAYLEG